MDNEDSGNGTLSWQEAGTMFHNEVRACVKRWQEESDLPYGMLISTLGIEKLRLEQEVIEMIEEQEDR